MPVFNNALAGAAGQAGGAGAGYTIERSLRYSSDATSFLSKTPASASNRKTFTFSVWLKRGKLGVQQALLNAGTSQAAGDGGFFGIRFRNNDDLNITTYNTNLLSTTRHFRDPSAWYHLIIAVDTTLTASQIKIYVNGVLDSEGGTLSQNTDLAVNNAVVHEIGRTTWNNTDYFDGHIAEIHFVDGQALDASSFGQFDEYGIWNPKEFTGNHGTNGYYLDFSDNTSTTTLGTDASANSNNWTLNNFSVASGFDNDSTIDSPTIYQASSGNNGGNYATLNALDKPTALPLGNANLRVKNHTESAWQLCKATQNVTSGKAYWEVKVEAVNQNFDIGVADEHTVDYFTGGNYQHKIGYGSLTTGDIWGVAYDADNGTLDYYLNGSIQNTHSETNVPAGLFPAVASWGHYQGGNCEGVFNFGATPFTYTPPTGYKSVCLANTDDPDILDPREHFDIKTYTGNGGTLNIGGEVAYHKLLTTPGGFNSTEPVSNAFDGSTSSRAKANTANDIVTFDLSSLNLTGSFEFWATNAASDYSIDGGSTWTASATDNWTTATNDISGVANIKLRPSSGTTLKVTAFRNQGNILTDSTGDPYKFSPDFVWIKNRDATEHHALFDQIRGATKVLYSSLSYAQATQTNGLTSFTSDGFNVGTDGKVNGDDQAGVAWAWKAASSTGTNSDGTTTVDIRANQTAGFSITKATMSGSETIGHGLGVAPHVVFRKRIEDTSEWYIAVKTGTIEGYLVFDINQLASQSQGFTSTTFNAAYTGGTNEEWINYAFTPIRGFSSFGTFEGTGTDNGPFVYTGFRPALVMIKNVDSNTTGRNWHMNDTTRDPGNRSDAYLNADQNNPEQYYAAVDIVSNGFKVSAPGASYNESNLTHIYLAWAENPFKYARAR